MIQYPEDNNEKETEETDKETDCSSAQLSIESVFPLHVKYFAHDIQLVIVELFKNYVIQRQATERIMILIGQFRKSHSAIKE
uniref:Uncharacterized protein n=1 Tax=Ditylenchus dipsaci TaxID=166011 RepID=A0A915ETL0_9BILA